MHRVIRTFLVAFALAVATKPLPAQTAANSASSTQDLNKRVRQLVHQAGESIRVGRYEEARQSLLEAWSLRKAPDIAGVLAQAEIELKLYADAAGHLDFAIANFSATQSEKLLETMRQAFEDTKSRVGQVRIVTNRNGAEILVDGRVVGASPMASAVYVDPGRHQIEVRQGADNATSVFEIAAGNTREASVPLDPPKPIANATTQPISPAPQPFVGSSAPVTEQEAKPSLAPVVIGGLVFAAGVATAIGFHFAANSQHDKLQSYRDKNGASGCSNGTASASDCAAQWDAGKSVERDRNWSTAGIVVGGTALVATALYWFWPREKSSAAQREHKSLQVTGSIQSKGSGIWVSGEF
jgi:hypothetical protein